jgi:hypothetical protein
MGIRTIDGVDYITEDIRLTTSEIEERFKRLRQEQGIQEESIGTSVPNFDNDYITTSEGFRWTSSDSAHFHLDDDGIVVEQEPEPVSLN